MMQKTEKNEEIEKVAGVFRDYMEASPRLDWFWSGKSGYVLLVVDEKTRTVQESRVIRDAGRLCRILAGEIAQETLCGAGRDHDTYSADPAERLLVRECLEPYREKLSEHAAVFEELFH